jgi:hypothetical protein
MKEDYGWEHAVGATLPLPGIGSGSELEDKEEEGLYWSHAGSSAEGWEELVPANLNGVANGLRLDASVRVAFDREGMREVVSGWEPAVGRLLGGREDGGERGDGELMTILCYPVWIAQLPQ